MKGSLDQKRNFLIATKSADQRKCLSELIGRHIAHSTFFYAQNGSEASLKITNAPPHIVIVESQLPKLSGVQLVEWALGHRSLSDVAMIILSPIPDKEHFVDEVVLGRVQFLDDWQNEVMLVRAINRALNFLASDDENHFHLRFMAPQDVLMKEGEKADSVYIVRRGQLEAVIHNDHGSVVLGDINEGEFVGEMAYINGEARSANVIAKTDCELIEIPVGLLDLVLFQKPAWSRALMKTLSKRVKVANQKRA